MTQTNTRSKSTISRRELLVTVGTLGSSALGLHLLTTYAPWIDYGDAAGQARTDLDMNETGSAEKLEMVRYASLAANGHNTQPWSFTLTPEGILLRPDLQRRLAVVDPDDRELWISLGCALENLLLTASALGYQPDVVYPDTADVIEMKLAEAEAQTSPLFEAIPQRQSTRAAYDGRPIPQAARETLLNLELEDGVSLEFIEGAAGLDSLVDHLREATLAQYADGAFVNELIYWLRFNKKEAAATRDGLYTSCSGNPSVPGWLGRFFVAGTKPEQQAEAEAALLRSASGALLICSATEDKAGWVRVGQVYQRLALQMTALGIKNALMNQPIEVPAQRKQLGQTLDLGSRYPQLLVRYGFADKMPASLRRRVEQVVVT